MTKPADIGASMRLWTRRAFMVTIVTLGAGSLLPAWARRDGLAFKPAVFDADSSSALIWLGAQGKLDGVVVEASLASDYTDAIRKTVAAFRAESGFTQAVLLGGLKAGSLYHYRVVAADGHELFKGGQFRTAPAAGARFTIAFTGDMGAEFMPFKLLDVIAGMKPHLFLHLGDTVYADRPKKEFSPSVRHYRRKHAEVRKDDALQRLLASVTTSATCDDHEIENNCHGGHPAMGDAMQVFREYWPARSAVEGEIYRRISWGGCDFFILDTRSHRSPQTDPDGAGKTMLGTAQKTWLLAELKRSKAAFKFMVTSVPFHAGGADTWASYVTERDEIAAFIKQEKISGFAMLSADYHMARDWTNAKTGLCEFMVGPIAYRTHFQMHPEARKSHERSGKFFYDGYNFGLLTVDTTATPPTALLQVIDLDGKVRFEQSLAA